MNEPKPEWVQVSDAVKAGGTSYSRREALLLADQIERQRMVINALAKMLNKQSSLIDFATSAIEGHQKTFGKLRNDVINCAIYACEVIDDPQLTDRLISIVDDVERALGFQAIPTLQPEQSAPVAEDTEPPATPSDGAELPAAGADSTPPGERH